jgi:hypothetical protein
MGIMSVAFIIGVVVFAVVGWAVWSNRQSSFSKNRLKKNADQAADRAELENH